MDALAGYGTDSESDEDVKPSGGGALSELLANYSVESDGNENDGTGKSEREHDANGKIVQGSMSINGGAPGNNAGGENQGDLDGHSNKRRRRWDNSNGEAVGNSTDINYVLPPPLLLTGTSQTDNWCPKSGYDPFHSIIKFEKDYTAKLRQKLSLQLRNQSKSNVTTPEKLQLEKKLEQLHDKFQPKNQPVDGTLSFAEHLKSQHEFGNPRMLKNIIDHFSISPLESTLGNTTFKRFEYVDRLVSAEERVRAAAASFNAGMGGDMNDVGRS